MNIFYLDEDIKKCASYHCDKHVVKMILEYAQLLSTAHHILDNNSFDDLIYKPTHINHPCSKWVRENRSNYEYLYSLFIATCNEYTTRYNKVHATYRKCNLLLLFPPDNIPEGKITELPQCMPEEYKIKGNIIQAYRNYYLGDKARFAVWKYTNKPEWWNV